MLLALLLAAAPMPTPQLTVTFSTPPEVHFNRRGDSTLTVWLGKTSQVVTLNGVPDPTDPRNVYLRLNPAALAFPANFSGPVKLSARLYLCDAQNGICTVEEHEKQIKVRAGRKLELVWKVGEDNRLQF
ncbi:hypothetical protein [Deinococcus arenicola]|uniref:Thiol:disulfide interchange protein DsbD N-terminal domain-containing protein n=1 Tax=Deinococcus arenicola TaxID=2994950 RepID=A0ABU4DSG8_9DEIO|nr:hypothetical protein [Deinococcus sp. ZS9-10]MDV6374825.1 hypothetical protein [Deinococcus sp. ZS9-10]